MFMQESSDYMLPVVQALLVPSVTIHELSVVNPRRMREGYCSRSVCVSVSLSVC